MNKEKELEETYNRYLDIRDKKLVEFMKENKRLHSIIKEVREYITNHREAVDERGEHIIYFLKDDFDEEDILKILDKDRDK